MSVNTNLCNDFLDAMQIITTSSVERAGYDKTIQAQVLSCQDATIGKYKCRYQDATIYAYSNSSDVSYGKGAYVYILVPGGKMSNEKTILGTTKKLGINYISQAEGDQAYDLVGNNGITSSNKFFLDSKNKEYKYTIYNAGSANSKVQIDINALEKYLKDSSALIVGATFKTSIPAQNQYRGHYGITYTLRFLDNTSNKQVLKVYTVDEDNMIDNPYKLLYPTRQYQIYDIDGANFIRVESIQIFSSDFPNSPNSTSTGELTSGDIEITALEITGANRLTQEELDGVAISFYTPQGAFFTRDAIDSTTLTVTAQVRVKGKLVSEIQKIPFYWGQENVGISPDSAYYNKYLGKGWSCLNGKNIIQTTDPDDENSEPSIIEWIPEGDTLILKCEKATAKDNKFKVAIVYDGTVFSKEINIQNFRQGLPIITIESSGGTKFYYDIGHPTLTCKVNGVESDAYKYNWAFENNGGLLEPLEVTAQQNDAYDIAVQNLQDLKNAIAAGSAFPNAEKTNLENLESAVKAFDFIQRVKNHKVYNVQISKITNFGKFKCSVFRIIHDQQTGDDSYIYVGTASITLINSLKAEDTYSLVINNGSVAFQYNEDGVAPNSKSLDVPQQIEELSFTIYDNLGNIIDNSIITNANNCKIRWAFPIKDSLLVDNNTGDPFISDDEYNYYENRLNLSYEILQKYDIKRKRNQIKLTIDYKGMSLTAVTDFTFAKQGQPGTNGTQYIVKIVPRTSMENPPLWPMITKIGSGSYIINYGIGSGYKETTINTNNSFQFFKVELWRSGDPVWDSSTGSKDGKTYPDNNGVKWQVLINKYKSNITDDSLFEVTNTTTGLFRYKGFSNVYSLLNAYANIIKCSVTVQGKTYYGTIPVTTAYVSEDKYRINLKDYTGWRYAIYTSDGVLPQYDSSRPFEFIMTEKIKDIWEDISLISGSHSVTFNDPPIGVGTYKSTGDEDTFNANLIEILGLKRDGTEDSRSSYRKDCTKNQWFARPKSQYDGVCVNAAIVQTCKKGSTIVGRISVPIHFLLNKYGMSQINEWDGNSIQLNDEGGFILAPQMGAGSKNDKNQFTGVLMGQTQVPGKNTPQTGLLGYSNGDRTFFLNSKNGSAIFGKKGNGQIIIEPSGTAKLYSHNFWKNYVIDGVNDGLPTSYNYRDKYFKPSGNCNGAGMLIDLSTPQIFFGSGDFYVNADGHVHAAGGGDIGGWSIGDTTLKSNNDTITLDSTGGDNNNGKIYSGLHDELKSPKPGFYLSSDGLSIGSQFKVDNNGVMKIGRGAVTDKSKHWTIDGNDSDDGRSYIAYGGDTKFNPATSDNDDAAKVYLGTDGFSLGKRFSVSSKGVLTAYSGTIGGWTLDRTTLIAGTKRNPSAPDPNAKGIEISSTGYIQSANFKSETSGWKIDHTGHAQFNDLSVRLTGKIAGWQIGQTTLKSTNNNLTLDSSDDGKIYSGSHDTLTSKTPGFYLSADGFSLGSKFKLTNEGVMYIGEQATITDGSGGNHWIINGSSGGDGGAARSYIAYGINNRYFEPAVDEDVDSRTISSVYLGTDGFSLGNRFSVSPDGTLTAREGIIGGWIIGKYTEDGVTKISSIHTVGYNDSEVSDGIVIGSNGTIQTKNFGDGDNGWKITKDGAASFYNIDAIKGAIGKWEITKGGNLRQISGNNIVMIQAVENADYSNGKFIGSGRLDSKGETVEEWYCSITANGQMKAYSLSTSTASIGTLNATHCNPTYMLDGKIGIGNVGDGITIRDVAYGNDPNFYNQIKSYQIHIVDNGAIKKSATMNANGCAPDSDIRLKTNIKDLDPSLAKNLRPVKFNFIGSKKNSYGFIAQEVQKVIPDVILQNEETGYLAIYYDQLIAPLYALVQQQQRTIEDLQIRLQKIERQK